MFSNISIYCGTSTKGHLSTSATSLKIVTNFLKVKSTNFLYIKPFYNTTSLQQLLFPKAILLKHKNQPFKPYIYIRRNLLSNVYTLNIRRSYRTYPKIFNLHIWLTSVVSTKFPVQTLIKLFGFWSGSALDMVKTSDLVHLCNKQSPLAHLKWCTKLIKSRNAYQLNVR